MLLESIFVDTVSTIQVESNTGIRPILLVRKNCQEAVDKIECEGTNLYNTNTVLYIAKNNEKAVCHASGMNHLKKVLLKVLKIRVKLIIQR